MLTWIGYPVWVQNNLAVRGRKFIGKRGQADVMGFRNKDGVILGCEVKTVGDRLSNDQIIFLNVVLKEWEIQII